MLPSEGGLLEGRGCRHGETLGVGGACGRASAWDMCACHGHCVTRLTLWPASRHYVTRLTLWPASRHNVTRLTQWPALRHMADSVHGLPHAIMSHGW